MERILIGSPIRQKPEILKQFLRGLENLEKGINQVSYFFIDDNTDDLSSKMLESFKTNNDVIIKTASEFFSGLSDKNYYCDNNTHHWNSENIERITAFKDSIIEYCITNDYDFLFLIDSDIVIDKRSLNHLISRNVDVVSNVFYTQWQPNGPLVPQCFWIPDVYQQFESFNKPLNSNAATQIKTDMYARIRVPGIYKVDGLGACTLITCSALKKGVRFKTIPNLSIPGEDRHFCIRAGVLGIDLFMDSVYPAYHIFREEYLSRVDEFVENGFSFDMCTSFELNYNDNNKKSIVKSLCNAPFILARKTKRFLIRSFKGYFSNRKNRTIIEKDTKNDRIVLQMTVHNECGKYLERCLSSVKDLIDYYVIIDDASTDDTVKLCENLLSGLPHTIIKNEVSMFHEEHKLRKKLWDEAVKHNPGWIMSLDADEVLEENGANYIRQLIKNDGVDGYSFKYYDMWNENEYREDQYWHSHYGFRPYIMRYINGLDYKFKQTNQHCGSFPLNYYQCTYANVFVKIKHYGWADKESREQKYERYMRLDPDGKFGNINQYNSIMDENPNLLLFDKLPKGV